MSVRYQPILWNKFKKQYDAILWLTIVLYLAIFIGYNIVSFPSQNLNTTLIRAFGTLAILLLHIILIIGPAARLSPKFLPVLYNRRHFGVSMFLIAAIHGILSLLWFHGNTDVNPLLSLFTANTHYGSLLFFPFQTLGFFALIILAIMAFTSHDFWLSFLTPKFWKAMHMLVYIAYSLIILHITLGIIQFEKSPVLVILLFLGLLTICSLHIITALKENKKDTEKPTLLDANWQYVCTINDIEENHAKMAIINKERIAVFKYDGKLSAVHNVCKHQMGPLGEGKVVNGCITCPWHGYQYKPEDGCAPAPFKEKLHTYSLRLIGEKIYINVNALPEGTYVEPIVIPTNFQNIASTTPFFVGWNGSNLNHLFAIPKFFAVAFSGLVLVTAFVLASQQKRLSSFKIDYDNVKQMEGWLSNKPVPMMTIIDGKDANGNPTFKSILLVDAFKKGANETVQKALAGSETKYVKLNGYLSNRVIGCSAKADSLHECESICTDCITGTTQFPLMEIQNGIFSFKTAMAPIELPIIKLKKSIDTFINGEIIDPKCYFGAMNPGQGKTHLSCAVRCISGGIMPVLKYEKSGVEHYAILVGNNGDAINKEVLKFIGIPVSVAGKKELIGNWEIFYVNPKANIKTSL